MFLCTFLFLYIFFQNSSRFFKYYFNACSEEHEKHSSKCVFVKLKKEQYSLTVSEMLLIAEEVDTNLLVSMTQAFD